MNVLFTASEAVPFVKTGGLADVIGSLPKALLAQGIDVRVILPKYEDIPEHYKQQMTTKHIITVQVGYRNQYCGIQELQVDGIHYYFIDNEFYFRRKGLYGYGDDAERYAFFCRAVMEALPLLDFSPNWIHCHDWQTGLIPFFLKTQYAHRLEYQQISTMFTIHNLKYQGHFSRELLKDIVGARDKDFAEDAMGYYDGGSCLKAGLVYADIITTVSKSYAEEIQTGEYGEKLEGLLQKRSDVLYGIVNGIDNAGFDPMTDPHITYPYRDSLVKKRKNKTEMQANLGLTVDENIPLIGIVSRLVQQKGFDLIEQALHEILESDVQLVVLGTGDWNYEQMFRDAALAYPKQVSSHISFYDPFARKIYAASDMFLMPSLFEPCGLGQLIALRYRSVPIVRETGGLKDTVQAFNEYTSKGNGFTFTHYFASDMLHTIRRAVDFYHQETEWKRIISNIAKVDYGWDASAAQYIALYKKIVI
ncbi:MAG: glycogen synthase GlgA [Paenibacillaceae bacterium]